MGWGTDLEVASGPPAEAAPVAGLAAPTSAAPASPAAVSFGYANEPPPAAAPPPDKVDTWETRNFNFGGLRKPGVTAGPNSGGFQAFETPEQGVAAIGKQLRRYYEGKTTGKPLTTIKEIVSTWAPPNENDTPLLVNRASQWMGVEPDQPIDLSQPETMAKMIEVMIRNEQGGKLPVDKSVISKVAGSIDQHLKPDVTGAPGWNVSPKAIEFEQQRADSKVVWVPPETFVGTLGGGADSVKIESYRAVKDKLTNGQVDELPSVDVSANGDMLKVTSVNGRARALAAIDAGVDLIPVAIHGVPANQEFRQIQGTRGQPIAFDFPAVPKAPQGPSTLESFGTGARDLIGGGALLLTHLVPSNVENAINRFNNKLADAGVPLARIPEGGVDAMEKAREATIQRERAAAGQTGTDWARLAGNVAAGAVIPVPGLGGAGVVGAATRTAAGGAIGGMLAPATGTGGYWGQKAGQAAMGAAAGGALGVGMRLAGKAIAPSVAPAARRLLDKGVRLTPGQIASTGRGESRMSHLPILGDMMRSAIRRAWGDFNLAVYRKVLGLAGLRYQGTEVGSAGVAQVEKQLGAAYDALKPKINFVPDNQFLTDLVTDLAKIPLSPSKASQLNRELEGFVLPRLATRAASGPLKGVWQFNKTVSGEAFKQIESELSHYSRQFNKFGSTADERLLGDAFDAVNGALRGVLERTNPAVREELRHLNTAWAAFKRLQVASARRPTSEGIVTAGDLLGAEKSLSGIAVFARGDGLLRELADDAQKIMGSLYPDSGTAMRVGINAMAGGGAHLLGLIDPATVTATAALSSAYSTAATGALRLWARTPSAARAAAGRAVSASGPYTAPGLGLATARRHPEKESKWGTVPK